MPRVVQDRPFLRPGLGLRGRRGTPRSGTVRWRCCSRCCFCTGGRESDCHQPSIRCPEGERKSNRRRISVDRLFRSLGGEFGGRDCEEVGYDVVLGLVVITALAFDFTKGFHDTGNAMATTIATGALRPRIAVALSGVLNLTGAFLSLAVAATIASGLVDTKLVTLTVVAAGLIGAIVWNLLTWFFGIPSSSSQALIGGVIGAMLAAAGAQAVKWHSLVAQAIPPAVPAPPTAALVAPTPPPRPPPHCPTPPPPCPHH